MAKNLLFAWSPPSSPHRHWMQGPPGARRLPAGAQQLPPAGMLSPRQPDRRGAPGPFYSSPQPQTPYLQVRCRAALRLPHDPAPLRRRPCRAARRAGVAALPAALVLPR